jgi:LmbE family N-acetylglucosaminyl deacetylase
MKVMIIGAHRDDCEVILGGTAALYVEHGHEVVFVAMTQGEMGHHLMAAEETKTKRRQEALNAAAVIGAQYEFLEIPECEIMPTLENRNQLIALMRKHAPDIVLTHPPIDYHPDHKYTSALVADAAFMLKVPKVVPDSPVMRKDPCFFYAVIREAYMDELKPAFCIPIDSVFEKRMRALHCHECQMYEWLPWVSGMTEPVPEDENERFEFLKKWRGAHYSAIADKYRDMLISEYGEAGKKVKYAEMAFASPFGRQPSAEELKELFRSDK